MNGFENAWAHLNRGRTNRRWVDVSETNLDGFTVTLWEGSRPIKRTNFMDYNSAVSCAQAWALNYNADLRL